jgi:D-psicose/D-tagatose/L-ribulose 3-epimerase
MKIGINLLLWTDHPQPSKHERLFAKIKHWGFDGMEIPIDPIEYQNVEKISKQLDGLHLQRTTITALDGTFADPSSREPKLRQAAIDLLKSNIEKTKAVGADLMVGPIFQGLGKFSGQAPQSDEWKYAVETIRTVAEFAHALDVKLAIEPLNRFEMYVVNTVADGAKFIKEVDMRNVGLLVDTHHGNIEEDNTAKAWDSVAEHIFHVHISENHRGIPGSGQAIPKEIFETLKKNSYDDWLTIEAFGQNVPGLIPRLHLWRSYSNDNDDAARLGIEFIRQNLLNGKSL